MAMIVTGNAVPSNAVEDLYDNSILEDLFVNSPLSIAVTRTGKQIVTIAGMNSFAIQAIQAVGYVVVGDYAAGLNIGNYNQVFRYAGEFYKAKATTTLPYLLTGVTGTDLPLFDAVGDAVLRTALAAANGTTIVGFGNRTLFQKLGEHVSCKDAPFNCAGDGVTDDTVGMQLFLDYLASLTQSGPTASGALTSSYTGTTPTGYIPYGTYRLTKTLNVGSYIRLIGEDSILKQYDDNQDIFDINFYLLHLESLQFVGGRQHLRIHNDNINSSMLSVENCQFFLSHDFSVKTFATGGVWTHMSANGTFKNCRWMSCHQIMDSCFDNMVLEENWYQPDLSNLTAGTAMFVNKGATPLDPGPQTRMRIIGGFAIPAVGLYGVDRPTGIRWADNYGSFISEDVRWGGEFGGMPICHNLGVTDTTFPWNTTEFSITGSLPFCGAANDPGACILATMNAVPQRMHFGNFSGTVSSPLIANLSSMDYDAYFTAFEAATGRKAYNYFKIDAADVITNIHAYVPLRPMLPDYLYRFLIRGRNTRVVKTSQSLLNGSVDNKVSFSTTTEFDNVGAFKPATPTRLYMPNGCNAMDICVDVVIDASDNLAKAISVQIQDSGGTRWEGESDIHGFDGKANPFGDGIHFTTTVYGPPDSYWELNIKHNGTTARNLITSRVTLTPTNMII